jgi:hypothetical protein
VTSYLHTITSLSTDTIILLALVVVIFFAALKLGRGHVISAILSLYVASFLYTNLFFVKMLTLATTTTADLFWNHLAIFLIFYIPIHFVTQKQIHSDFGRGAIGIIRMGVLSVAAAGLLVSIFYHVIPLTPVYNFSPAVDQLFASDTAFAIWLIAPLVLLFF